MSASQRSSVKTLLVVEDDFADRDALVEILSQAGYRCIAAADGESGLALAQQTGISAAVVDLRLPGMTGAELARRLTQMYPGLPVVAVTGSPGDWDEEDLRDLGFARTLSKPFKPAELVEAVRDAICGRKG